MDRASVIGEHDIFRLDIVVGYLLLVAVVNGLQNLLDNDSCLAFV